MGEGIGDDFHVASSLWVILSCSASSSQLVEQRCSGWSEEPKTSYVISDQPNFRASDERHRWTEREGWWAAVKLKTERVFASGSDPDREAGATCQPCFFRV